MVVIFVVLDGPDVVSIIQCRAYICWCIKIFTETELQNQYPQVYQKVLFYIHDMFSVYCFMTLIKYYE